jgi:V8-like Glu-specific endopeptidase
MIFLLGACGQAPEVRVESAVRQDPIPNEDQIAAAKNGKLICDRKENCHSAVALVSVATSEGLNRCTGFLIDSGHLLTNSHCLPDGHLYTDNCGLYVHAHFLGDEHRSCKRITKRSKTSEPSSRDYAVIELDRPLFGTSPLRLSKRGFRDLENATVYRVDMTQDLTTLTYDGVQSKVICQASHETMLATNVRTSLSPLMTFGDCPVKPGHSGSPILNANGEAGAINQAFLTPKDETVSEQIRKYLLDESFGDLSYGTQIRCVKDLVGETAQSCTEEEPIRALFPEEFLREQGKFNPKSLPPAPLLAYWLEVRNPTQDPFYSSWVLLPKCISQKEANSSGFRIISLMLNHRLGLTRYLQAEWRVQGKVGDRKTIFVPTLKNPNPRTGSLTQLEMVSKDAGTISIPICRK